MTADCSVGKRQNELETVCPSNYLEWPFPLFFYRLALSFLPCSIFGWSYCNSKSIKKVRFDSITKYLVNLEKLLGTMVVLWAFLCSSIIHNSVLQCQWSDYWNSLNPVWHRKLWWFYFDLWVWQICAFYSSVFFLSFTLPEGSRTAALWLCGTYHCVFSMRLHWVMRFQKGEH